jgi:hypothetical protein
LKIEKDKTMNNEFKYEIKTNIIVVAEELRRNYELTMQNHYSAILQSIDSLCGRQYSKPLTSVLYNLEVRLWEAEKHCRKTQIRRLENGGWQWTTGSGNYQWEIARDGKMVIRTRFRSEWRRLLSLV